ncbi:MAG: porin, partial [Alistipes sp.]|nr:porin [Alistipes sp.]
VGWGVQFSGHVAFCSFFDIFFNGVYGEGITPYIQDLTGSPYDFIPNPEDPERIETQPMWGWQAAGRLSFIPGVFWVSGGYSNVNIEKDSGYLSPEQYKKGQYIFANLFCNVSSNCTLAVEYLRGYRKDVSDLQNTANRVSLMVQYNF